jgi:L-ascorbate metabolism protein UlaG (beta-lactamase superfamily)
MFNMIAFAAIACLAQTEAQAGGCPATAVFEAVAETHRNGAIKWPRDYLLHVAFSERVVINGASAIVQLHQATIFIDPVGTQEQYRRFGRPDIVILTRAHPDHLSIDTMIGMLRRDTVVLAPQAVIDLLPLMIANNVITPFEAGMTQVVDGVTFRALSASSNIPSGVEVYPRARGDIGVVLEFDGASAYF